MRAPDHVLAGLMDQLAGEGIISPWITVEQYRGTGSPADEARIAGDLDSLETAREGDTADRAKLKSMTEWLWPRLRRVLPDDNGVGKVGVYNESQFKQRLNLKSLERGAHYMQYYKFADPTAPEGWWFDTRWTPRLLWKQERPNAMLFLRGGGGTVRVTDMKNVRSWRQLQGTNAGAPRPEDHATVDDERLAQYLVTNLTMPKHVINFEIEQTLGFVNDAYAPDLDRTPNFDKSAMLMAGGDPKPGARKLPLHRAASYNPK